MRRARTLLIAKARLSNNGIARAAVPRAFRCLSATTTITPSTTASMTSLTVSQRYSSTNTNSKLSAVNVEEFTLNEEVVRRDMENMARWNELSEAIDAARAASNHAQVLAEITKGLAMLEEMGTDSAPIQCETLLCMEGSQAHFNTGSYGDALALARRARDSLTSDGKPELQDRAQIAEIDQFIGFILYKDGKAKEAHEVFTKVLNWIDVDAKTAMPMQAVAAVNLRRSVLTGVGQSLTLQAQQEVAAGNTGEAKELYGTALDILIEGLNKHIDENDFALAKSTLESILGCFEGLQDVEQAVTTCRKYISWCSRHEDSAGVEQGRKMLADLCERHGVKNPLLEEEEGQSSK